MCPLVSADTPAENRKHMHSISNTLIHPVATPTFLVSLVSVLYLLYVLYEQQPPPFWNERCVAWKSTKKSCDRCCASYGKNHLTTSMVAQLFLLVHCTRRLCQSTLQCTPLILSDALVSIGLLLLPVVHYLPNHRWVCSVSDSIGILFYLVGFLYCVSVTTPPVKHRAGAELLCWCGGGALFVFSQEPIRFDSLTVVADGTSTVVKTIPLFIVGCISVLCCFVQPKEKNKLKLA